jgi:uncharacterized protein HemX
MWFGRKKIAEDVKRVAEVAGEQIAPGAGTLILLLATVAVAGAGAGAYYVSQKRKIAKKDQ